MKRIISAILIFGILCSAMYVSAVDAGEVRVVIGDDLTEAEIARVYGDFQLERGTVRELTVSNEDEYALLGNSLDSSVIGTVACSCVYIRVLPEGSGCKVERHNIAWCTEDMYKSALATAGINDVSVVISAPFEVSGTAALVGIYKAYEDMTGTLLSADAKSVSVEELLLTGELAEQFGSFDASLIVESLKGALEYTATLTDEELKERIAEIADEYHVTLNDSQIQQLLTLCRQMEKLDELKLREKVEEIRETVEHLREMKAKADELQEKARGWRSKLKEAGEEIFSVYRDVASWLDQNSDKLNRIWADIQALFVKD